MQITYFIATFILGVLLGVFLGVVLITRTNRRERQHLSYEFENLANRIFEEKSSKFNEQNQQSYQQNQNNLAQLLTPLKERIKDFEAKVHEVYHTEGKERAGLREQITHLFNLNQQITTDTKNLTRALKGDNKLQGNWGEMILETILNKSGLVCGIDYLREETFIDDGRKRYRPDVIVNLPDNKKLIIDSKVSLVAYERAVNAVTPEEQQIAIKEHIKSLKEHIKNLSSKNYQMLYKIKSLDFVLMFMGIESALTTAMQHDAELFEYGLKHNVLFVCPSTLLATMRTVASVWRTEKSLQNTNEIAKIGGELYDRFVNFIIEMQKLEAAIQKTQAIYSQTMQKLQGQVGVLKSVNKLKELGAKTSKTLPVLDGFESNQSEESIVNQQVGEVTTSNEINGAVYA